MADPPSADETGRSVNLGRNIRASRQSRGISLRELARRVGISASALSQVETGRSRPSVATLYEIVRQVGATPEEIFFGLDKGSVGAFAETGNGHGAELSEVVEFVRRDVQQVVVLKGGEQCRRIGGHSLPGVDCLLITYEPGAASPGPREFVQHAGHEFNYMMSGELAVDVREQRYHLKPGDSLTFPSRSPHRMSNPGDQQAQVLCLFVRGAGPG